MQHKHTVHELDAERPLGVAIMAKDSPTHRMQHELVESTVMGRISVQVADLKCVRWFLRQGDVCCAEPAGRTQERRPYRRNIGSARGWRLKYCSLAAWR